MICKKMDFFVRRLSVCGVMAAVVMLAGCNIPKDNLAKFNAMYTQGNLPEAQAFCEQKIGNVEKLGGGDDLLWALQMGMVSRQQRDFAGSTLWFDRCEDMMKVYDPQNRQTDVIGTTLVNDNIIPYRGWAYDGILVNTYKAMNFMAQGDSANARIEFNRAMERQTRAKEQFSAEIQKEKDKLDKAKAEKKVNYDKSINSDDTQNKLKKAYPELYDFEAYPDFVNPFSTYLAGVFFTAVGDPAKARDLLRESTGMLPDNPYVKSDFEAVEQWLTMNRRPEPAVWVFFENGLGPTKEEFRIDLPLFLVTGKVYYAGIALPKLVKRQAACDRLTIQSGGQYYPTEIVGDMDRVVQTEFSKEFPWILTRAIIAMGAKAAAQYALNEQNNNGAQWAAIAMAFYNFATTAADVRIWSAMPKNFQVAKLPMPGDGQLTVQTPGGYQYPVAIPSCKYAVVHIKMVTLASAPVVDVITY